jgi:hypothetical protein
MRNWPRSSRFNRDLSRVLNANSFERSAAFAKKLMTGNTAGLGRNSEPNLKMSIVGDHGWSLVTVFMGNCEGKAFESKPSREPSIGKDVHKACAANSLAAH